LDFRVLRTKLALVDRAVLVLGERVAVSYEHFGFGDEVQGLLDSEDGDWS
jgi:hypothetical protein